MLVKCYELITRTSYSWIFLLEVLLFVDITILTTSAKYLKKKEKKRMFSIRAVPELNVWHLHFFLHGWFVF
jgi:hypothetical protein